MPREPIILPERAEGLFGFAALFYIAPCAVQGIFPGLLIASEPYIIFAACLTVNFLLSPTERDFTDGFFG